MPLSKTYNEILDRKDNPELVLELLSFAGGENTIGEDQELKTNEARTIENWDSISLGGMERSKGFTEVSDGGASYSTAPDGLFHHFEGSTVRNYVIIGGDLAYKNGSAITQQTAGAFTSGTLCGGVSAGSSLWITNTTDNLKRATIAGGAVTPAGQPSSARERVYYHKSRLVAEGGGVTVYGSRASTGNWTAANAWSATGDAWNIDLPDLTKGCAPNFPSGNEILVFTEYQAYSLYNFPNVAFRPIESSHGCSAPFSIAQGNQGVCFISKYPTLGVYLYDRVNFINLTINEDWIEDVDLTKRCFGVYRENTYHLFYNEIGSGVSYPNVWRIYDFSFGRWMKRPINASVSDTFGYPAVLHKSSNEFYIASSQKDKLYQLEDTSNSDNTYSTEATYTTKDFTSRDFGLERDEVRLKLLKMTVTYYGTTGNLTFNWIADRGLATGSQTITISSTGALVNTTFTINTSSLSTPPPDKTLTQSFGNSAIGRRFNFQIRNTGTSVRPKIKKIKIVALALDES